MNLEERMTLCNMVIEAGGKNGVVDVDSNLLKTIKALNKEKRDFEVFHNDSDAQFELTEEYDASKLVPIVAKPHLPSNIATAEELSDVIIHQAYIGSCTGGKTTDFKAAAKILYGHSVKSKLLVVPATMRVYNDLITTQLNGKSLQQILLDAGAIISAPACGACLGGYMGVLASGERCISSTNRNFQGRMGSTEAEIYLASPLTVAASAITGKITDPREFM
jgi:3-isopropylmalate/(R)-2-methylmalate dehydratase large subunit